MDPRSITLAASELFEQGHYPSVVAVCSDALTGVSDHIELRILMARALVALRQDSLAKRQLGLILQQDPNSSIAFQLLGEIAFRADDLNSAEIYFKEATRLNVHNEGARIWLDLVESMNHGRQSQEPVLLLKPKRPMPASGHWDSGQLVLPRKSKRRRFAKGTARQLKAPSVRADNSADAPIELPRKRPARTGRRDSRQSTSIDRSRDSLDLRYSPRPGSCSGIIDTAHPDRPSMRAGSIDASKVARRPERGGDSTRVGRHKSRARSSSARSTSSRPAARSATSARLSAQRPAATPPPIPGQPAVGRFGGYLIDIGVLTPEQLRHALKHHIDSKMRVGEAAVVLGFVSQQKLDWAALGFHCSRE